MLVLLQMVFTNTNKGMVKIGYFSSKLSKLNFKCQSEFVSQYHPLFQYDLLINKSNQSAVIVFH